MVTHDEEKGEEKEGEKMATLMVEKGKKICRTSAFPSVVTPDREWKRLKVAVAPDRDQEKKNPGHDDGEHDSFLVQMDAKTKEMETVGKLVKKGHGSVDNVGGGVGVAGGSMN